MDTNAIGTLTEMKCMTRLMEMGFITSVPQIPSRYDFILDTGKNLFKVQVKTSHLDESIGFISFNTASSRKRGNKTEHITYKNDNIDFFATYYDNECYLIPVLECGSREKRMRVLPTRNGQVQNICFLSDYLPENILKNK